MKKWISALTAVLLAAGLAAGCGQGGPGETQSSAPSTPAKSESSKTAAPSSSSEGSKASKPPPSGKTVRIAWNGMSDEEKIDPITGVVTPSKADMEKLLSDKTGHTVEILPLGGSGWIQQLETLVASGEADVARYTNQVQIPVWLEDLTQRIADDPDLGGGGIDQFVVPYAQHYMRYKSFEYPQDADKIYGLPFKMTHSVLIYDKQIFEEWGVAPPKEGDSFDTILEIAKKVHGTNPVTGKQNFGLYIRADRLEFDAISFDALPSVDAGDMNIKSFDKQSYVESLKSSPELLHFYQWLEEVVKLCPPGITTNAGAEKFLTDDNDIAISISPNNNGGLFRYYVADMPNITGRFIPFSLPLSKSGMQGFPEFASLGVAVGSKVKDAAWDVVKCFATDKEALDLYFCKYDQASLPVVADTAGMQCFSLLPNLQQKYTFQRDHGFITDDYWYFRTPVQPVIASMLAAEISPEQARQTTYEEVKKWVENKEKLAG